MSPIRHVFLGSKFSEDDEFLTPIGVRMGVDVHAATASEPRNHPPHAIGFLADVILATFFFAPLIHYFWHRYFESRTGIGADCRPERAYLWIISMLALMGIALAVLVFACTWIFVDSGIWISPVPMAIETMIDGLILDSVAVSTGLLSGAGHSSHSGLAAHGTAVARSSGGTYAPSLKDFFRRPGPEWLVASLPCLAGAGIVVWALWVLIKQEMT